MRVWAFILGLLLAWPAWADMYPDASNAKLPEAQDNLGIGRSVKAYGAKCDGTTDDTAAINAAFAEARASLTATRRLLVLEGMAGGVNNKECRVTSLNATGFTPGSQANRLLIRNLSLVCSGAGNTCLDMTGSLNIELDGVTIRGDSGNPPKIGLQHANTSSDTACCINTHNGALQIVGSFTFAALYNMASESTSYTDSLFANNHSTSGPIINLGAITGGSGYVNATYTNVPLTGGAGSGALATVTVSGGAVSAIFVSYEGQGYAAGNVLSAAAASLGGTGSGFSVPVTKAVPLTVVMDGQNHWRATSAFNPITKPVDTGLSFTQNNFYGGSIRNYGGGHPVWLANTRGFHFYHTYLYGTSGCGAVLFDNGAVGTRNNSLYADLRFEAENVNSFCIGGGNANPVIENLVYRTDLEFATVSVFGTSADVVTVAMKGVRVEISQFSHFPNPKLWGPTPSKFNVSADFIYLTSDTSWEVPNTFTGTLCAQDCVTTTGKPLLVNTTAVIATGDMIAAQDTANGTRAIHLRNLSNGAAALARLAIGNDNSPSQATISVNSSANTTGSGVNSTTYNSIGKSCFAFNSTNGLCMIAGGVLQVLATPTSCAGQPTGAIWNDTGTLKVCP